MRLLVLAKEPVPGRVKTRLCPPLRPSEAAEVAAAALHDTLTAAGDAGADERVLALDGAIGPWLPSGWRVVAQHGATFAERLGAAWAGGSGPTLQIGMDTPQVTGDSLNRAMGRLSGHGCVIGPADDGGWWALGMATPQARMFDGVPMSTSTTCARQIGRLRQLGLRPEMLETLTDVDTWADAVAVAGRAPGTRFADVVTRLAPATVSGDRSGGGS
jgi:uncharacterized protein